MSRKKLITVALAIALQGALAWAVVTQVVGPKMRGEPLPWEKDTAEAGEEATARRELGPLLPIDEVLVNVAGTKGRRYCRTSLALEMEGKELTQKAPEWMPVFRGRVIELLSTKSMDQLTSPGARDSLKAEILQTLNAEVSGGEFRDLFFTEFLVQ